MDLQEAFGDFLSEQEYKGNSAYTITFYREHFGHYLKDTNASELEELAERSIRVWLVRHKF